MQNALLALLRRDIIRVAQFADTAGDTCLLDCYVG
jgi:hypothetical protein